jgi:hypothetical protein
LGSEREKDTLKMPYKSDAQRRWAHTKKGTKALGGSAKVSEWDKASKGKKLPEKVKAAGKRKR